MEQKEERGTIKWFGREDAAGHKRRFGFILPDNGGKDVFLHLNHLVGCVSVKEGDRVSYQLEEQNGRMRAINVKLIGA